VRRLASGDPARGGRLLEDAVAVLRRLPAGGVPLSVLAARSVGDGHALDPGRPLATLVLRAAAALGDVPPPQTAEGRRTAWAAVGVLDGELTNPVLVLNLPVATGTTTGRVLAAYAAVGEPVYLSARQLVRDPPQLVVADRPIFVCENPTVVATAAARVGAGCAPVVCVSGHPGAAATVLLRRLSGAGAVLHYHGDFDWPGVTIAGGVMTRFGARPWRFGAADYRAGLARGGRALRGTPASTPWDPELARTMRTECVAVEEETVLDDLLRDLAT
ncbi:MAG: TIGR02679 family protein, partial [Streptosporangiaceae bacterium]